MFVLGQRLFVREEAALCDTTVQSGLNVFGVPTTQSDTSPLVKKKQNNVAHRVTSVSGVAFSLLNFISYHINSFRLSSLIVLNLDHQCLGESCLYKIRCAKVNTLLLFQQAGYLISISNHLLLLLTVFGTTMSFVI